MTLQRWAYRIKPVDRFDVVIHLFGELDICDSKGYDRDPAINRFTHLTKDMYRLVGFFGED